MRLRASEKVTLYNGLAKMVRAGFGIPKATETMLSQKHSNGARLYLTHLQESLKAGKNLADSTKSVPLDSVSQLEKEIIAAGERGGQIESAYNHLSDYFAVVHKTSRHIRRKLYYPLILLTLAVLLPALPKAVAAPKAAPVIINAFILLGIIYAGLIILFFIGRAILKSAQTSVAADSFLRKIPLVGPVRKTLSMSRFCKVFHIYLLSAFRISECLRSAGAASASARISSASNEWAEAVEAGHGFSEPLADIGEFDHMFKSSFTTAEMAGDLDGEAERWSKLMTEEAHGAVERLGEWAPRIFYALIAVFVIYQIFQIAGTYINTIRDFMP